MASPINTLPSALQTLESIGGRVITPDDLAYDTTRAVFYGDDDKHPAAIVRVADVHDVRRAIADAQTGGYELAVRSGGHSVAGHSSTEGGIVIDLRHMAKIDVEPVAPTVTVAKQESEGAAILTASAHPHPLHSANIE